MTNPSHYLRISETAVGKQRSNAMPSALNPAINPYAPIPLYLLTVLTFPCFQGFAVYQIYKELSRQNKIIFEAEKERNA